MTSSLIEVPSNPRHPDTTAAPAIGAGAARRVLVLDHTARMGGGEVALLNLVRNLDPSLYQPVVLLFSDGPLALKLAQAGIETHVLPLDPRILSARKDNLGIGTVFRLLSVWRTGIYACRLARWIGRHAIDVVHTNSLKSDIVGGVAAKLARKPLVWHIRDRIEDDYLPRSVVGVFRLLCRILPDSVVANSAATLQTLRLIRRERAEAIHSGIDLGSRLRIVHDGLRAPDDVHGSEAARPAIRRIGLVGRISPWKGQHVFLEAAAQVHARFPEARFQIIGAALFEEREYEARIHQMVDDLGLGECVEFTGFRDDITAAIGDLEIVVHASITGEPFGQVVIEGMAAAKPVVATAGGGVVEIVVDGVTGLLVPMGDASAMAAAICHLLDDRELAARIGLNGRQRVREHFTIQNTAQKVQKIYDDLLAKSSKEIARTALKTLKNSDGPIAIRATTTRRRLFSCLMATVLVSASVPFANALNVRLHGRAPVTSLFIVAVALSTWLGDAVAGLLALLLSIAAMAYVLPPSDSFAVSAKDQPLLAFFCLFGALILILISRLQTAHARTERARADAEAARRRLDFLASAGTSLTVCHDPASALRTIGYVLTRQFCDWCLLDVLDTERRVHRLAFHRDLRQQPLVDVLSRDPTGNTSHVVQRVIRSGAAERHLSHVHDVLGATIEHPDPVKVLGEVGADGCLMVPLSNDGNTFGALTLVRCGLSNPFSEDDLKLATEFSWRAAAALNRLCSHPPREQQAKPAGLAPAGSVRA